MGLLVNGEWHDQWYDTRSHEGEFIREDSQFRSWITKDGSPGPSGVGGFAAEVGRYHLYVSLACPWAHRTLIFRELKQLQNVISVSVVEPHMLENGWQYAVTPEGTADTINGFRNHYQLYQAVDAKYTGRVTVPVLWDKQQQTIVNNESSEIIRILNSAFENFTNDEMDYYPQALRNEIDAINKQIYADVNNGVYRSGFATSQKAYERAFRRLFSALDNLEMRLSQHRYLVGNRITEADWRLFTTLVRFDAVYVGHFKCNLRRIADYENLSNYVRELYQIPGIAGTVNFEHIKQHYYYSHATVNPSRVVPLGPAQDFSLPHDRGRFQ